VLPHPKENRKQTRQTPLCFNHLTSSGFGYASGASAGVNPSPAKHSRCERIKPTTSCAGLGFLLRDALQLKMSTPNFEKRKHFPEPRLDQTICSECQMPNLNLKFI
jgi:hypothetical protein